MAKKKTRAEELQENLQKDFQRWEYLNTHGGSDPLYEDGFNMNIVRNHVIYDKRKCQEELEEKDYPKEYFRETPPQVDNYYMARMDEIRENAKTLSWSIRQMKIIFLLCRILESWTKGKKYSAISVRSWDILLGYRVLSMGMITSGCGGMNTRKATRTALNIVASRLRNA